MKLEDVDKAVDLQDKILYLKELSSNFKKASSLRVSCGDPSHISGEDNPDDASVFTLTGDAGRTGDSSDIIPTDRFCDVQKILQTAIDSALSITLKQLEVL